MKGAFAVRRAAPADLCAILAVEQGAFTGEAFSRRQLRYLLGRARGAVFVAMAGDRTAGYISLLLSARHGHGRIYSLAVAPEYRGQGLAGSLVDAALTHAREMGAGAVFLEVGPGNLAALALYKKKGFQERGRKPVYYKDGSDAVSMVRREA